MSFAEKSLPPSDRDDSPAADPSLIAAIKAKDLSNSEVGRGMGYSSGAVSTYLNGKYEGDLSAFETAAREWLRDLTVAAVTGVPTIETEVSKTMSRRFEEIRAARELALVVGDAGIGKSRGDGLYLIDHTLAISFRALPWRSGMNAIAQDLSKAAGINRLAKNEKRWDAILDRTQGSGRLLVVDDAQELAPRALQCCIDYHEETGNPVCLIGLPSLKKKLLADARRARRVDAVIELKISDPTPLIKHLVCQFAPDANGDADTLLELCRRVATGVGAFGAVEKQLKYAARSRKKQPGLTWPAAFRAAHLRLLRNYSLN
jgi:transcriptional regulator with XRE-family HTH domain